VPTDFLRGLNYVWSGLRRLNSPGLRPFVLLPVALNLIIFASGIGLAIHLFDGTLEWLSGFLPSWLQWLEWIIWPLFVISLLLLGFYTFALLATLIGLPFYGLLSEKTTLVLQLGQTANISLGDSVLYAFKNEPKKLSYTLSRSLICLPLFLIPGVNLFAPAIWFLVVAWTLALEYLAFPAENQGIAFTETRRLAAQHRWLILGFGVGINIGLFIPIANFVILPAAVVGATQLWRDLSVHPSPD
jgi:CysZ protein